MRKLRRTLVAAIGLPHLGPARRDDPAGLGDPAGTNGGGTGNTNTDGGKPTGDDGDAGKKPKIDGDLDPDRAARAIAAAREAEKKAKERAQAAEAKHQSALDAIAVALGLKPDPKADPAELVKAAAAERDKAMNQAKQQAVELAVYRSAGKAGADPDALLDSRTFLRQVEDLDPTATDFADKIGEAIKKAVETNPKLAAGGNQGSQGPARQGADHTGSAGTKQRPASLGAALAARLGGT